MDRQKVTSSMIASVGYDPATETLHIEFTPRKTQLSGAVYAYEKFTADDWQHFKLAKSIGKHFGEYIKDKFKATRVEDPVEKPVETEEAT